MSDAHKTDGELLEMLQESARSVFASLDVQVSEVARTSDSDDSAGDAEARREMDVQAVIPFDGSLAGVVVLRCSRGGAKDIARSMLMLADCTSLGIEDVQDAVGECANMVCGRLKQQVEPELFISPPEVGIGLLEKRGRLLTSCVYELSRGPAGVEIWLDSAA